MQSFFQKILGTQFGDMPPSLKALHGPNAAGIWEGEAKRQSGTNILSKFIARLIGLRVVTGSGPISVTFLRSENTEIWVRDFGGHKFNSHFSMDYKNGRPVAIENFGPFKFELDLKLEDNQLKFIVKQCRFLGMRLSSICLPKGDSYEYEKDGHFHFNVEVRVPVAGLIAAYDGWLKPID